ncbi:MAG: methionyl-tRNA formyltransferase, partial [Firmicutes bacterium]|nr:methionyl-tRNA formyltransferase [Bacillota bacterium]
MRIIFMGTAEFAVPSLSKLYGSSHEVLAVVTQVDKPKGRGYQLAPSPVKEKALSLGLPVFQPKKLKDPDFLETFKSLNPDLVAVAAYAKLIPPEILYFPAHGCINVHPSLIPDFRGPSPVESAIMAGRKETGITIFFMNEGYDTGDVILQKKVPLPDEYTGGILAEKLADAGAELLLDAIDMIEKGTPERTPQDLKAGSYTRMIKNEDCLIDWNLSPEDIHNKVRALNPKPSALTRFRGKILKVLETEPAVCGEIFPPGEIVDIMKNKGILIACKNGCLLLKLVQPEGKKLMKAWDFALGYKPDRGEKLSSCVYYR